MNTNPEVKRLFLTFHSAKVWGPGGPLYFICGICLFFFTLVKTVNLTIILNRLKKMRILQLPQTFFNDNWSACKHISPPNSGMYVFNWSQTRQSMCARATSTTWPRDKNIQESCPYHAAFLSAFVSSNWPKPHFLNYYNPTKPLSQGLTVYQSWHFWGHNRKYIRCWLASSYTHTGPHTQIFNTSHQT